MKKILIIVASGFLFLCLSCAALIGWNIWHKNHVPLFTLTQQPEQGGMLTDSFLTSIDTRYIQTRAEYSLELSSDRNGGVLIGRTEDGLEVRKVRGNDDYVTLSGFMFPALVFRREGVPPFDLGVLPVEEIRLKGNQGNEPVWKSSFDPNLIAEVTSSLLLQSESLPQYEQIFNIELSSPDLPGLVVSGYLEIDSEGTLFLAPLYDDRHGAPAGPLLTQWVSQLTDRYENGQGAQGLLPEN